MHSGAASLFVDRAPGTAAARLTMATLTFSNVQPGQALGVELISDGGPAFSSNPPGVGRPGLAVEWRGGVLPLQWVQVGATQIEARTTGQFGGEAGTLVVTALLAGSNEDETFVVRSNAPPGVTVTLGLGFGQPQVIGEAPTTIQGNRFT